MIGRLGRGWRRSTAPGASTELAVAATGPADGGGRDASRR